MRSAPVEPGVTIGASATPCQHGDDDKCGYSDQEGGQALDPHVNAVEGIAIDPFSDGSQQVVAPLINGEQQVGHHAAIAAVRR